ncbi:hypothetical protein HanIR_Chr01g0033771 [Helianthus annuus]|nr:hypothetical protein HanIR_Chr01g0033771 [Helianthus annuus]
MIQVLIHPGQLYTINRKLNCVKLEPITICFKGFFLYLLFSDFLNVLFGFFIHLI